MALIVYYDEPFFSGTQVDEDDFYTGDGVTLSYTLVNKNVARLAGTVQFGGTQYYQYNGGFVRTASGFTLNSAPAPGTQGVAPGQSSLVFDQLFDQDAVDGVPTPRVQELQFFLIDNSEIPLFYYNALPTLPGVGISIVDSVTSYGALQSFIQLACATNDAPGTALTYQATGTELFTGPITAFGSLIASSVSGASSLVVDSASGFYLGDYILVDGGAPTQEIIKIIGYSPPYTLLTTGQTYNHYVGETVYACGRKFWAKCTVPLNYTNDTAATYIDLALRTRFARRSRI